MAACVLDPITVVIPECNRSVAELVSLDCNEKVLNVDSCEGQGSYTRTVQKIVSRRS